VGVLAGDLLANGLAIAVLLLLIPASARAAVTLQRGAPMTGNIRLVAAADPPAGDLHIVEQTDAGDVDVASGGQAQVPWTCQTTRTFAAVGNGERSGPVTVTTPSCATRLRVIAPRTIGVGDDLRVSLVDGWHQGNLQADVCATAPAQPETCTHVDLPVYQWIADAVFRATTPGQWRVEAYGPAQTVGRSVLVVREHYPRGRPTILTTGDSMMLATGDALRRGLRRVARMVDDTYVGSGISRPFVIDWLKLPGQQITAYRPDATVITLGMEDGRPLDGIGCCGPDWVTAYARRVRTIMQTYLRGARGAVVWLNEPFQRNPKRAPYTRAVNAAYSLAANGLARVKVVDLASAFTPAGTYRSSMTIGGHRRRVRCADGIHFTRLGGQIAGRLAIRALRNLGISVN
jgi:hypothetical protein